MCINIKELCKLIKRDSKRSLVWTLEEGLHYITNRHWAVRFNELPRDVLVVMFAVFAKLPTEGQSLVMTRWGEADREKLSLKKIFEDCERYNETGDVTNIIIENGDFTYRVIQTEGQIIKIDNNYLALVNKDVKSAKCAGRLQPIMFGDGQVLLLPIRFENSKEDATINELLAG